MLKIRAYAWYGLVGALSLLTAAAAQPCEQVGVLFQAAAANQAETVRRCVAAGVPVDARNAAGATPLLVATQHNSVDAAAALIDAGADVNAKDHIQDSPYLYAGARGHLEILKMTLAHGADVRSLNRYQGTTSDAQGRIPLALAKAHGYTAIEKILKVAGAREP